MNMLFFMVSKCSRVVKRELVKFKKCSYKILVNWWNV